GGGFDTDIVRILHNAVPERVSVLRESTAPTSPYLGTKQTVFNYVNNGLGYIAYFGHGGAAVWDDPIDDTNGSPFLVNTDVIGFTNQSRFPIILSMTCFTATYDGTNVGILNTLQNQPSAGTVACMGTESFGWEQNDEHLAEAIVPHLFDSIGGTIAERIVAGKMDYYAEGLPGDLLPPTLIYCYHYLGDPMLMPYSPSDKASLSLSSRVIQPSGSMQITGTSSIANGIARIELTNNDFSPLVPAHSIDNIPITNGSFSYTDNVPGITVPYAAYRATIYQAASNKFAAAAEDVTITESRVTELDFEPHPLPVGTPLDFSAAIQTPNPIKSITANVTIYRQNANGIITTLPLPPATMTAVSDRYHTLIAASELQAGDKLVAAVTLLAGADSVTSDSVSIVVGAAEDPSVWKDKYHRTLTGKLVAGGHGLAWQERIYNWGASPVNSTTVSLLNLRGTVPQLLGSTVVQGIASHADTLVTIPIAATSLDSVLLAVAVTPESGNSPLNLRDSIVTNDTTLPMPTALGVVPYLAKLGTTTIDGTTSSSASFNANEAVFFLPASSEGNIAADVTRLSRIYAPAQTSQPDIHFLPMYSDKGAKYAALRVVSDSLGSIALTPSKTGTATLAVQINPNDSLIKLHANDSLFLYRLDDRSKLWTILPTARAQNTVTATITNLGTFAVAYNSDKKPPVVDLAVEGEIALAGGEVAPQPHIDAIIQDANGIDVTPGKTIVKIDNRILQTSEYSMIDSGRTLTTVNLTMQPNLSAGSHSITVQATDDNGNTSAPKELDCHISNSFGATIFGSFPNPFTKDYMFIAYQIAGISFANSVALDIYTVSGRRIRTMNYPSTDPSRTYGFLKGGTGMPTSLGYHEVWWDGRDDGGSEVANGVYFYRLTVATSSSTQELKGKFARLR
ncbi:MAG TPA: C25 family cysteine peptidase, partial [Candidatus Kapabacteria bacterium]